jgi:hypothetical protein
LRNLRLGWQAVIVEQSAKGLLSISVDHSDSRRLCAKLPIVGHGGRIQNFSMTTVHKSGHQGNGRSGPRDQCTFDGISVQLTNCTSSRAANVAGDLKQKAQRMHSAQIVYNASKHAGELSVKAPSMAAHAIVGAVVHHQQRHKILTDANKWLDVPYR